MTTIISPNKKKKIIRYIVPFLAFIMASASISVIVYSGTVDLRHELEEGEAYIQELNVKNAELKDILYSLLDTEHLEKVADTTGLVLENHPFYLETGVNELVSNNP